jgi:hypothetical protein
VILPPMLDGSKTAVNPERPPGEPRREAQAWTVPADGRGFISGLLTAHHQLAPVFLSRCT